MNSGHETGPEDPPEAPLPGDESAQEDQDVDWATWRQGPGYSRPVPPEPESESESGREPVGSGSAGDSAADPPYERHVPRQPGMKGAGEAGGDPVWASKRSPAAEQAYQQPGSGAEDRPRRPAAPYEPGTYRSPGAHQESTASGAPPPAPYVRGSYPPPGPREAPGFREEAPFREEPRGYQPPAAGAQGTGAPRGTGERPPYDVPQPRPYVSPAESGPPGRYGGTGNHGAPRRTGEPDSYDEPGGYNEPIDHRPDDADSGASRDEQPERYQQFWEQEGRGGGAHASPQRPSRPAPPPPPPGMPSDTSVYRSPTARRQLVFLGAAVAVIVAAGITAAVLLLGHGKPSHPAAAGHSPSPGHSPSTAPSGPASPAASPPLTGASGRLSVPHAIGPLRLNPALTDKFVGASARHKDANSFFIKNSDVVSGFYTTDPAATTFTAKEPRLMFLAAYLAGSGNPKAALHDFMTNGAFTGQHQVSAGPQGSVAACGWLPQRPSPVAHCMWADANSYADFYSWNSSPSALAKTMISARPQIEHSHR